MKDMAELDPPAHLTPETADWWRAVLAEFALEPHHLRLLRLACEAWDRTQQAREILDRDGLTTETESGGLKAHPCIGIERDARLAFARLLRELDLDAETASDRARPPALRSNRR
jgi:P27 family predicted phage terminase small subunit